MSSSFKRPPRGGGFDSRILKRFFSFSRIPEYSNSRSKNPERNRFHEFPNKHFDFLEFSNDISSFPESRTKSFSRIPERYFSFSRIPERKKGPFPNSRTPWGGPQQMNESAFWVDGRQNVNKTNWTFKIVGKAERMNWMKRRVRREARREYHLRSMVREMWCM